MKKNVASCPCKVLCLCLWLPVVVAADKPVSSKAGVKNLPKALAVRLKLLKVHAAPLLLKQAKANVARVNAVQP